ncbi:MAG TPA: VIT domain-containing protein [Kofleriaceae bacterium]|nr:VIT domain-containing protein [Kofleriaceae bacterium]
MARAGLAILGIWAGVAAALIPLRAHADSIETTYGGEVVETAHRVTVARVGARAVFTVRRQLESRGDQPDEVRLRISLPSAAVVDRLRYLLGGRWREGVLMERESAEELYERLTGTGGPSRRGPALLAWTGDGRVELSVFPVAARGTITVEYRLAAPLCYERGHYITDYPLRETEDEVEPQLRGARVVSAKQLGVLLGRADLEGLCAGLGHLAGGDTTSYLVFVAPEVTSPASVTLGHAAASTAPGAEAHVVRLELRVPAIIEPAPARPRVVFALDASHSVGEAGIQAQLSLVRGYLAHTPDARVEIVIYRRRPHRLFGRFVAAASLDAELKQLAAHRLAPGNGSDLGAGLALAVGIAGSTRLVAFTDDRLATRFDVARAAASIAAASPAAVLHLVTFGSGGGPFEWTRDDDHRLVPIARARGGVVAEMTGNRGGAREAMLGLVRPLSIDHVRADVPGVTSEALRLPASLGGGDGYRGTVVTGVAPAGARVTGMIWGRTWTVPLAPDPDISRALPAMVFGHEAYRDLDETVAAALAYRAGVVSPFTSFVARDPSAPPTSYEPPSLYGISGRSGVNGCGCSVGVGHTGRLGTGSGTRVEPPDRIAALHALLDADVRRCLPEPRGVTMRIETTTDEIVDVTVQGAAAATSCIEEAAWNLRLPTQTFTVRTDAYHITF